MPSPPPSLLLQPLFMGKRWGKAFLGVLWPFCTSSLLSWHSPACITPNQAPFAHPFQCTVGGEGGRMVMKNGHTSSLPAKTKSQRAVLPSLLGAAAGDSSLFWGSSKTSVL